jgi:hypothetical protein
LISVLPIPLKQLALVAVQAVAAALVAETVGRAAGHMRKSATSPQLPAHLFLLQLEQAALAE